MTDKELDAIEARANAATDGPWSWDCGDAGIDESQKYCTVSAEDDTGDFAIAEINDMYPPDGGRSNARFIAHAREDVPDLVAEVKRLGSELGAAFDLLRETLQWDEGYGENCACASCDLHRRVTALLIGLEEGE